MLKLKFLFKKEPMNTTLDPGAKAFAKTANSTAGSTGLDRSDLMSTAPKQDVPVVVNKKPEAKKPYKDILKSSSLVEISLPDRTPQRKPVLGIGGALYSVGDQPRGRVLKKT